MQESSFAEVRAIAKAEMLAITDPKSPVARRALDLAIDIPASALARALIALDRDLGRGALREAALGCLRRYGVTARLDRGDGRITPIAAIDARGEPVPRTGPLIVVSNHPGLYDALVLFAAIGREDLATLAARRPLFEALPNVNRRLLSIDPGASAAVALRRSLRHLRGGGALLHFPAGQIEPDPRVAPRGEPLVRPWKPSLDALLTHAARSCPGLQVIPAMVSGVISRRALRLAGALGKRGGITDALVPLFQLTLPGFDDIDVRVRFGAAAAPEGGAAGLRAAIESMSQHIRNSS